MLKNMSRQELKFVDELIKWDKDERGRVRLLGHLLLALGTGVFVYTAFSVYWGDDPRILVLGLPLLVFGAVAYGVVEAVADRRHRMAGILAKLFSEH